MNLQIAENLRRLRQERNMTQAELADRLGVSYQAVSRWENKSSYPDIELLPAIASLFGVTVDYLLGNTERRVGREWWDTWKGLSDPGERLIQLRRMHRAFPEDQEVFYRLCEAETSRDECYRLSEEFLAQCSIPFFRNRVIKHMIFVEDEERVMDYIYAKNIPEEAWDELLEQRYRHRGDEERLRKKQQWVLFECLRKAFAHLSGAGCDELCANPGEGVAGARTVLAVIAALTDTHLTEEHPVAGDGEPDLWYFERIWAGITLACAAAHTGDAEQSLRYLEDAVNLLIRVERLPRDAVLSYRTHELNTLDRPRAHCTVNYDLEYMERTFAHPAFNRLRSDSRYAAQFEGYRRVFMQHGVRP